MRVDLRAFKSVWIKIRVAETPKEGVVRVARGDTLTQKMYLVCNLRIICVDKKRAKPRLASKTSACHPLGVLRLLLL